MMGEAGLTREEVGEIVAATLDGLIGKGVSSAVLIVHVEDGKEEYFRIAYRGGVFAARGLIATGADWIKGDLTQITEEDQQQ
jgi:hypothetical protein